MKGQTHGGKGDTPRPVDKKKYDENFDRIFGVPKVDKRACPYCGNEISAIQGGDESLDYCGQCDRILEDIDNE